MKRPLVVLAAGVAATVGVAIAVPPSSASWIDQEWIAAGLDSGLCGTSTLVDGSTWSAFLAGDQGGTSLATIPSLGGLAVDNVDPATSSAGTSTATATSLGSDAWSSILPLTGLSGLTLGGSPAPLGSGSGSVTQFGRATATGLATAASGAVTVGAGGAASLETAGATTPRSLALELDDLLAPSLGSLGLTPGDLSGVRVGVGPSGALATVDACDALWQGLDVTGNVTRSYLVDGLDLGFTSTAVTDFAAAVRTSLTDLEASLDAVLPPGTPVTGSALASITTSLTSALNFTVLGIGNSLASVNSVTAGVDVDLAPVAALVAGVRSDGVVSVDLSTGEVTADLGALWNVAEGGTSGLTARPANSPVLTAGVVAELTQRVRALLSDFVSSVLRPAVLSAIDAATVTTVVDVTLRNQFLFITVAGVRLVSTITGSVAGYQTGSPAPTVSSVASEASANILGALLSLVGLGLPSLLNAIESSVEGPLVATSVPVIASSVVAPWKVTATAAVSPWQSGLTGAVVDQASSALAGPVSAIQALVPMVVNAQPDAANALGSPLPDLAGRVVQSALVVRVVDDAGDPVASVYVATAAVGPATLR